MSLQFNDTTNYKGLIQGAEVKVFGGEYGSISNNTTMLKRFAYYFNNAINFVTGVILESDTRWQFDDTNYTDYPIGTTDLVDGQQDYQTDVTHLKILGVEVRDSSGKYVPLKPIDTRDMTDKGIAPTEFLDTDGLPIYYDKIGASVFLYPAPSADSVTTSSGLKIRYQRGPDEFTYTDTTKVPGIPSLFHPVILDIACSEFCLDNSMDNKYTDLKQKADEGIEMIREFYAKRDKDEKPQLRAKISNFK